MSNATPPLSAAAESALDEAVGDIRREVAWRAGAIASGAGGDEARAGVRDVYQALVEVGGGESTLRRRLRVVRIATLTYSLLGLIVTIFMYIYRDDFSNPSPFLISGALIGSAIGPILTWVIDSKSLPRSATSPKDAASPRDAFQVVRAWIELEAAIRVRYSVLFGESRGTASIGRMISGLAEEGILDEGRVKFVRRLLNARNAIVHGKEIDLSMRHVRALTIEASRLSAELNSATSNG
ncbi:hypothetical protein ABZ490_12515 [Streptomyces sp. NPDC005811]|uniref:hypothetical protein n=1 Tax=Streptomyces sp. NPDC005811 TaxID=3154565 RepID=UPI0033C90267